MANQFSLLLVIITLVTGLVWLLEKFYLSKKRAESEESSVGSSKQPWWVENSISTFPVIAFVLVLRSFIYEPFQIPSGSMMPTLLVGDFILVEKYSYGLKDPVWRSQLLEVGEPERGDIAVFKYPPQPNIDYIKRVVGLPGDTISYKNKSLCIKSLGQSQCKTVKLTNKKDSEFTQREVTLTQLDEFLGNQPHQILNHPLQRDQLSAYQPRRGNSQWIVPEGHYFVLGDNRDNSADSRYWGFVPKENLVGKAVAIWISFEFDRNQNSVIPSWIPTGVRFNRIGGID